ncbi:MAG: glutamate--tRNA ligase family protein [Candidatus Moduliflexus flocculans]|nr:glutamate--tRNA ligase family protein [Candidatus Moduliflexus flocculans]
MPSRSASNFGIAAEFGGRCNLRFDDTNPTKEDVEYVESIMEDVRWLGFDWDDRLYYASDYFEQLYDCAVRADPGRARPTSDDLTRRRDRASTAARSTEPGQGEPVPRTAPSRRTSTSSRACSAGEFPDGAQRAAREDRHGVAQHQPARPGAVPHPARRRTTARATRGASTRCTTARTASRDAIEGITHSICTLEFEDHRPLYDWFLEQAAACRARPRQIEFARLNLTYTVMSKRKLLQLVQDGHVSRLGRPAHADHRRHAAARLHARGASATSAERIGVAKRDSMVDVALLEYCVREDLNRTRPARMAVLRPLRVIIDNYPEGGGEELDAVNNPEDPEAGTSEGAFLA